MANNRALVSNVDQSNARIAKFKEKGRYGVLAQGFQGWQWVDDWHLGKSVNHVKLEKHTRQRKWICNRKRTSMNVPIQKSKSSVLRNARMLPQNIQRLQKLVVGYDRIRAKTESCCFERLEKKLVLKESKGARGFHSTSNRLRPGKMMMVIGTRQAYTFSISFNLFY
ncbi:hypothetical protein L6452_36214 [Arctium lappa]|uniref:Uncharacterized protein n=1 Tax=Arctium lappa TaxID=4217 RepID=A0ACB8Y978_ARCLA|nr:hypothetical protein L6452_36214 [Arctium lappa]